MRASKSDHTVSSMEIEDSTDGYAPLMEERSKLQHSVHHFHPKVTFERVYKTYHSFLALRLFSVQRVFWGTAAACEGGSGVSRGSVFSPSTRCHRPGSPQ